MSIGTVIPDLDNTLSPEEVRRKTFEEKYATAFNKDQREILDALIGGSSSDALWKPDVASDGMISWERSTSTETPSPQNIKGAKGDKGDTGATGPQGEQGPKGDAGSVVAWDQKVSTGTNIATLTIDGDDIEVYAPEGGGGSQVQADWTQSDSSAVDFIKHKPTIPAAQVQSDWNVTSSSSKAFIKNKPAIPRLVATKNIFLGGKSARLSELENGISYGNKMDINLTSTFWYDTSNWQTNTPSQIIIVFPISRIATNLFSDNKNFLTFTRDAAIGAYDEVRYTCKVSGSDFAHMVLPSGELQAGFWFENSSGVSSLFPTPSHLNTVWDAICYLYKPTSGSTLGSEEFQYNDHGTVATTSFNSYIEFDPNNHGNVFIPMFLFYCE